MINANELRIGNKVLNVDNDIVTITEIRDEFYLGDGRGLYYFTSNGIPLTHDILEKCGFEKMPLVSYKRWCKYNPTFYLQLSKRYYYVVGYKHYPNGIQHLHQLQNLYFALTGQELEVNL